MNKAQTDLLAPYRGKRRFKRTPEPEGGGRSSKDGLTFVIQKHWARRLHYDLRLEWGGTMKSWAVPKGPSLDPSDKRMAVHVEDHPLSYNRFEGEIPAGEYGAGHVIVWDRGRWHPLKDPQEAYRQGKLDFELQGEKLAGRWTLLRTKNDNKAWLLIKIDDDHARASNEFSVVDELPDSVIRPRRPHALPLHLSPQLATLTHALPAYEDEWLFEIKFDGYRLLARIEAGHVSLWTRNKLDWSHRLSALQKELRRLRLPDGWYDGEIVSLNNEGRPDFQRLQNAFDSARVGDIDYFLFDLPFGAGQDLRQRPLAVRRGHLERILQSAPASASVRLSPLLEASARDLLASACELQLEGIIAKRKQAPYVSKRSEDWLKLKCDQRQEFVVGGYTSGPKTRAGFGALLLGVYDSKHRLRYVGKVGSGFSTATLHSLYQRLQTLASGRPPFALGTPRKTPDIHWVRPELVAEVSFAQWTGGGHVRQAVFRGLRNDKPAADVHQESAQRPPHRQIEMPMATHPLTDETTPNLTISHANRIVDRSTQTSKGQLVRYYAQVASLMLVHVKNRPVSFLRAPQGIDKPMFFQKHAHVDTMKGVQALAPELDPGHDPLVTIMQTQGLTSAAQMNVVEFHTWNAVKSRIDRPDRMIFDLDPGKGIVWAQVQEAALLMRVLLDELSLISFIKTSGGQGLHIVVPLQRRYDWDTVKGFSRRLVEHMAHTFPDRFSAKSGPRNRVGKIFIDYLRNGFGATTVSAWSVRARPGMAISVPIAWDEVESLTASNVWHLGNIDERMDVGNSPWDDYAASANALGTARRILRSV